MRTGALNARPDGWRDREFAITDEATGIAGKRRPRLIGASRTLRCLALAAGMVTIFGTPAAASCRTASITFTIAGGGIGGGGDINVNLPFAGLLTDIVNPTACNASASGTSALSIGSQTSAFGDFATAMGANASASGGNATAIGQGSNATGAAATATGSNSAANGSNATATGAGSVAAGNFATATGHGSLANGINATATGQG